MVCQGCSAMGGQPIGFGEVAFAMLANALSIATCPTLCVGPGTENTGPGQKPQFPQTSVTYARCKTKPPRSCKLHECLGQPELPLAAIQRISHFPMSRRRHVSQQRANHALEFVKLERLRQHGKMFQALRSAVQLRYGAGGQDDWRLRMERAEPMRELEAIAVRQREISQQQVDGGRRRRHSQRLRHVSCWQHPVTAVAEDLRLYFPQVPIILHDQQCLAVVSHEVCLGESPSSASDRKSTRLNSSH